MKTIEQRKEIYKKAYEFHLFALRRAMRHDEKLQVGICFNIRQAEACLGYRRTKYYQLELEYPELKKLKPKSICNDGYWWSLYDYDIRKDIFKKYLINKL